VSHKGAPIGSVWICDNGRNSVLTVLILEKPNRRISIERTYQKALYSYISTSTGEPHIELYEFFDVDLIERGISNYKWRRVK
jgi:hypothetical protein